MDKTQAQAIAQAILEPDLRMQEEVRQKRAKEALALARQRKIAGAGLAGGAIGAVSAYLLGGNIATGLLWGCLSCAILVRLGLWLVGRSNAG
ncbi:MAG: hypothetical protein ACOH1V_13250 [Stenotrophomonas sp.]